MVFISLVSYELYHRKRDRFEEETKKQLVGNIVLTRLVGIKFTPQLLASFSLRVWQQCTVVSSMWSKTNILWYVCNFIWVFVLLRYNNKTYRIDDVAFDQNPKCTFTFHTGEQMSYLDYYRYKYIDLKRKRIPFMFSVFKASSLVLVPLFAMFPKIVKWSTVNVLV